MARRKKSAALLPPRKSKRRLVRADSAGGPALEAIWNMIGMIPRGQVSTYGAVARAAGLPGRARLTGRALKVAPDEMHLPWHRVVGAGGRIVFPETSIPFREQTKRLKAERVPVHDGRVDPSYITDFENR